MGSKAEGIMNRKVELAQQQWVADSEAVAERQARGRGHTVYGVFACSVKNMLAVAISSCTALMSSASGRKTEYGIYDSAGQCKERKRK